MARKDMSTEAQEARSVTRETVSFGLNKTLEFWGTRYDSAHDKVLWFKQFQAFVKSGFARNKFTRRLYDGLYGHMFGHIAHYDIHGFWDYWFSSPEAKAEWVEYAVGGGAYGFHDYERKDMWGDVERAVSLWLTESGFAASTRENAERAITEREIATLEALKAKYESGVIA